MPRDFIGIGGLPMLGEVVGRCDGGHPAETKRTRYQSRIRETTDSNGAVDSFLYEIHKSRTDTQFDLDIGIVFKKARQRRDQDIPCGQRRNTDAQSALRRTGFMPE